MVAACGVSARLSSVNRSRSFGSSGSVSVLIRTSGDSLLFTSPKNFANRFRTTVNQATNSGCHDGAVEIGPAVAEELPGATHVGNFVKVEIGGKHFVLVA